MTIYLPSPPSLTQFVLVIIMYTVSLGAEWEYLKAELASSIFG